MGVFVIIALGMLGFLIYAENEMKKMEKDRKAQMDRMMREMAKRKKISEDYKENYTKNYNQNNTENYKENYKEDYTGKTPCIHTNSTGNSRINASKSLYQDDPIKNVEETKSTFESEDDDDAIKYL